MATKATPDIYLQWDILYKTIKPKKERDKIVDDLIQGIKFQLKEKGELATLTFDVFKSESNTLLYTLRVYKKAKAVVKKAIAAPARINFMAATPALPGIGPAMFAAGPIRPIPPSPPPPGVQSLTAQDSETPAMQILQ